MSVETWKEEFYPVVAALATRNDTMAAKHSLQKWKGLCPDQLAKHGLARVAWGSEIRIIGNINFPQQRFSVRGNECALCHRHVMKIGGSCTTCPLTKAVVWSCNEVNSSYVHWVKTGDAEPMIRELEAAVKWCEKNGVQQ